MTHHKLLNLGVFLLVTACAGGDSEPADTDGDTGSDADLDLAVVFTRTPDATSETAATWFEFSAPDAASYLCALDEAEEAPCEPSIFFVPMELGVHELVVRAVGPQGEQGEPAGHGWTIASVLYGDHPEMVPTEMFPAPVDDDSWRGIFRINCDFAHSSYNDPIVSPGDEGAAHLHRFYGNLATDHMSTWSSLYEQPGSSCQGNSVNATAYWVPALLAPSYDEVTDERLLDDNGDPAWEVVPAVVGNDDEAHEIFYYSAGIDDLDAIENIPSGLRIIAGNAATTPSALEQDTSIVRWHCQTWESSDGSNPNFSASIPECFEPDRLRMDIFFPSCWDGVNLDSDNHKSHMAYPVSDGGPEGTRCPESHPVAVMRPSYHYAFPVLPGNSDPATSSSRGWRLASDGYTVTGVQPGGLSLHGDWFNAWEPEVLQAVLDNCIRGELDCHDGNLANGLRLSGTTPGTQLEPEIVNDGHGGH